MRPLLLDLFCGAGGAAMGYHRAGFDVVGVDIDPQPNYPFRFVQADALAPPFNLSDFDVIHASPPCQRFTALKTMWNHRGEDHPDLLEPTRNMLRSSGRLWVIENVPGAPLRAPIRLCGSSFGLGVEAYDGWRQLRRHRLFESSLALWSIPCAHNGATIGLYGDHARDRRRTKASKGRDFPDADKLQLGRDAMDMQWADKWREISEAIPPAYTEWIGTQLLAHLEVAV